MTAFVSLGYHGHGNAVKFRKIIYSEVKFKNKFEIYEETNLFFIFFNNYHLPDYVKPLLHNIFSSLV